MNNQEAQAQPVSPSMQMMQILWPGAMAVQAIHVAAKFALADLVASGPKSIKELTTIDHMQNFFECIKSRKDPNAPVETGVAAARAGQMVNLVYQRNGKRRLWI
jgi:hypothetical protein